MGVLGFDNNTLELDEETTLRLMAICAMFRMEEQKEKSPGVILRDSVARIHATLLQGKPAYTKIYLNLLEEKKRWLAEKAEEEETLKDVQYPNDFLELDTGIESIFLKRKYCCPLCENAFTAPALKTGSLLVKLDNRTQMEVYVGVRQDSEKEFTDFSLFHIMVCPNCLFAAQEREFDIWDAGAKEPQWIKRRRLKLSAKILSQFHERIDERRRIAQKAGQYGMRLFSTARTENDAAIALDLAAYTLNFLMGKVSTNRKAELMYQLGLLHLMKSLQFEKELEDPELVSEFPAIKKRRLEAVRDALVCFLKVPDASIENFEVRESVRFNARKFWAAHELKHVEAFAQAGASLQRTYNQFTSLVKKSEREYGVEEMKCRKLNEEIKKAKNIQKKEQFMRQLKEVEKNMQLIRAGMENYRGVVRVVNPIYDTISVIYDKFREMQRQRKRESVETE